MLFFTYRGSQVVVFHRLTVKMPHIIFPGECFFFFPIMANSSVIVCKVNIDSLVHGKLLLFYQILLFASGRYSQIKKLRRNLPLQETKVRGFLFLHTYQVLFCVGNPIDLLPLLSQLLVLTFSKFLCSFKLLKRNFVLLIRCILFLLLSL